MPMYVFKCRDEKCGHTQNKKQKYEDPPPPCERCEGQTERGVAQSSFILKGGGWFKTSGSY